jgi:hypothetical protein
MNGALLLSYQPPKFHDRLAASAKAKTASAAKFHSTANADDPAARERQARRREIVTARAIRAEARQVAQQAREKEMAAKALIDAELAAKAEQEMARATAHRLAEQAEAEVALAATQKEARDARYAARKAAKKVRRRGY